MNKIKHIVTIKQIEKAVAYKQIAILNP